MLLLFALNFKYYLNFYRYESPTGSRQIRKKWLAVFTCKQTRNRSSWGDVAFIQEIVDGIGTGSRRARQDRLNKILDDEDKKKKLIHLICRIKGEKVYDDVTEVGSVQVDVNDVELVAENIVGKVKLEIKSGV